MTRGTARLVQSGLGAFVKQRRGAMGMTQDQLAAAVGARDRTYISQVEGGKIRLPEHEMRLRLAHALRVREVDLLVAAGEVQASEVADSISVPLRLSPHLSVLDRLNDANLGHVMDLAKSLAARQPATVGRQRR